MPVRGETSCAIGPACSYTTKSIQRSGVKLINAQQVYAYLRQTTTLSDFYQNTATAKYFPRFRMHTSLW